MVSSCSRFAASTWSGGIAPCAPAGLLQRGDDRLHQRDRRDRLLVAAAGASSAP